jgi:hypothetical protein
MSFEKVATVQENDISDVKVSLELPSNDTSVKEEVDNCSTGRQWHSRASIKLENTPRTRAHLRKGFREQLWLKIQWIFDDNRPYFLSDTVTFDYNELVSNVKMNYNSSINFLPSQKTYKLDNILQKIFIYFQHPNTCKIGSMIGNILFLSVLWSVFLSLIMTLPDQRNYIPETCDIYVCNNSIHCPNEKICAPIVKPSLQYMDTIILIIFSFDYIIRVFLCHVVPVRVTGIISSTWDEEELLLATMERRKPDDEPTNPHWYLTMFSYITRPHNIIDLISILPFFFAIITSSEDAVGLSFLRIARILRALKLAFRSSDTSEDVFSLLQEVVISTANIICFILLIGALVVFASGTIAYELEKGDYVINDNFPNGAWVRKDYEGTEHLSPFQSSFTGYYWAVTTMTTVGYGDIYPISIGGKVLSSCLMIVGLLFMSLPIAIVGSKTTVAYENLEKQRIKNNKNKVDTVIKSRVCKLVGLTMDELDDELLHVDNTNIDDEIKQENITKDAKILEIIAELDNLKSKLSEILNN